MPVEGQKPLRLVIDPQERAASAAPRDAGRRALGGPYDLAPDDDMPHTEVDMDEGADEESAKTGGRGHGGVFRGLIALIVLAVFAGVAWYAYNWGVGEVAPGSLPVIEAEPGPIKSRPESPGGMEVPYQDQAILNDVAPDPDKPQVERLLPPPEVPVPPEPLQQAAPDLPSAEPPAAESQPGETAPSVPETVAEAPALVAKVVPEVPAATAAAAPVPATAEVAAGPSSAGNWVVQLASLKSRDGATAEWARLQKKFPDLIGPRALDIQSVDIAGQGTFHRLRVGYFADRAAAVGFCERLKAGGQDCLAAKR